MAQGKKKEAVQDTNRWMTTYTDLMILLLTFFVLLLSLSTIEEEKKRVALNSLIGAFGFKPGGQAILGEPKGLNITMGTAPVKKEKIEWEKLRNIRFKNGLESDVTIIKERDRLVLTLNNRILFQPQSSNIEPASVKFLSDLADFVKDSTRLVEMRGYCAPNEIVFEPDPAKYAMVLSSKRASAVYDFFRGKGKIPVDRLVAHGFGANSSKRSSPKKKNLANRQVEIILNFKEEVPYRLKKDRKDSMLDFKGFLFKVPGKMNE